MTTLSPRTENVLRQVFKYMNRFMILMFRLDMAWWFKLWPAASGQVIVLVHIGRKSGLTRRTPVNYAAIDGDVYVTAGFGAKAHWYRNIMANPHIEVWHPDGWWRADCEDVSDDPARLAILRQVLIGSGFASFMARINPYRMPDDELDAATGKYRLLRIRLTDPLTGPGGPRDLAWVWQLMALGLLPRALRRQR